MKNDIGSDRVRIIIAGTQGLQSFYEKGPEYILEFMSIQKSHFARFNEKDAKRVFRWLLKINQSFKIPRQKSMWDEIFVFLSENMRRCALEVVYDATVPGSLRLAFMSDDGEYYCDLNINKLAVICDEIATCFGFDANEMIAAAYSTELTKVE